MRERVHGREVEGPRTGTGADAAVHGLGVHEHPGVEDVVRVEDPLVPGEGLQRLGRVDGAQQLRAGAAVTVLAGDRSAVAVHEFRRAFDELPVLRHSRLGVEVEGDADVHAALAEVPEGDAAQAHRSSADDLFKQ